MESYLCLNDQCGREFAAPEGPTICAYCRSINVKWVSYGKTPTDKKSVEQRQQEVAEKIFVGWFYKEDRRVQ